VNLAKKSLLFRKLIRKTNNIFNYIFYSLIKVTTKTDEKMILFSCYGGKSYACSPKAIYEYFINNQDKYKNYKLVWIFKNSNKYKYLENNPNTTVVEYNSFQHNKYLAKSKYWFINFKIQEHIYPKKNQVFVQCWHGTPLKKLGYDLEHYDNALNTVKEMKKRYYIESSKISYILSPSKFATEKFISAWNLKEFGRENIIIEKGYPRNDFLYNYSDEDVKAVRQKLGIEECEKKVILYAPTYRGNQHQAGLGYTYKEEVDFDKLKKELQDKYIILFRPHYFVANQFDFEKYKGFVYNVANVDDVNDLYLISDILITDYSSVFFDYANLKRPIIFHMYDLEHYRDESNGFYLDVYKDLPGKITKTDNELISEINRVSKEFVYDEKYKEFNNRFNYLDDGQASKRVVEAIVKE
jgi:CDP-glycerol glycerophosphotransferase